MEKLKVKYIQFALAQKRTVCVQFEKHTICVVKYYTTYNQ